MVGSIETRYRSTSLDNVIQDRFEPRFVPHVSATPFKILFDSPSPGEDRQYEDPGEYKF